jgi:hypothetical protein
MTTERYSETKEGAMYLAEKLTNALTEELGGKWEPQVWQNVKWHHGAKLGRMWVYPNAAGPGYVCQVSNDELPGSPDYWAPKYTPVNMTPGQAVVHSLSHVQEFLSQVSATYRGQIEQIDGAKYSRKLTEMFEVMMQNNILSKAS